MAVNAYDSIVERLIELLTPEQILAFKASPDEQLRIQELLDKNNAATITEEEQAELERAVAFERKIALLKARVLGGLQRS